MKRKRIEILAGFANLLADLKGYAADKPELVELTEAIDFVEVAESLVIEATKDVPR